MFKVNNELIIRNIYTPILFVHGRNDKIVPFSDMQKLYKAKPGLKEKMLHGLDDIDLTLAERDRIEQFEARHRTVQPWLFGRG